MKFLFFSCGCCFAIVNAKETETAANVVDDDVNDGDDDEEEDYSAASAFNKPTGSDLCYNIRICCSLFCIVNY